MFSSLLIFQFFRFNPSKIYVRLLVIGGLREGGLQFI